MKIMVLGGQGQIGWELQRALAPLGDVMALRREARGDASGDLENADGLRRALRRLRPDVIANAAAYTDVDQAESEPERARRVNAEGPEILAAEARRLDAWLIQYSTDYVFDGSGTEPRQEDAPASPLNVYGRTKWQGEQAVRDIGCRHLILRTQWVYSSRRNNFLRTVLRLALERDALEVVDDQIGAPTGADLVADVTAHLVRSLSAEQGSGTYHVAARGETTRHAYACFVVESARRTGWPLRLTERAIAPVARENRPGTAVRPRNGRLSVGRLERTLNVRMPHWRTGVAGVIAHMRPHLGETL
ncbi:MAG TPA: dTDP-4-dehydrorhamnose reductase [Gammaproteobacteria bacterium]|nr:dTDP-4-dehydrorhamnose reductase [Gammaproteobacteria bacterium]